MKWKTNGKRLFAFLLAAVLMFSACPLTASAEGTCSHHQEHTGCGYVEASACTHECSDGSCNYQAAVPAADCDKNCTDTDGDGQTDHVDGCAYNQGTAEVPCDHVHNEGCGYAEGHACEYQCSICAVQAMIDALPEKQNITTDNAADVKAQIAAIEASGVALTDVILDKYTAAKEALGTIEKTSTTQETRAAHQGSLDYGIVTVDAEGKVIDRDLAIGSWNAKFNCVNNEKYHYLTPTINCKISAAEFTSIAQSKIDSSYTLIGYCVKFVPEVGKKIDITPIGSEAITVPTAGTAIYFVVQKQYTYTISYDTQSGSYVAPTTTTSAQEYVTLNVTKKEPTRDGYTFKGWAESANATTPSTSESYTLTKESPTKTLYAVWKENSPESTKPDKPTEAYLESINGSVYVKCTRCAARLYTLDADSYNVGEVEGDDQNGYTCKVTVYASKYVEAYSSNELADHSLAAGEQESQQFTLKFENDAWTPVWRSDGKGLVAFQVECKTPIIDVQQYKLTISKTAGTTDPVQLGGTVTYTVTVKNETGITFTDVYVQEEPDDNLEILSMSTQDGTCDVDKKLWTISRIEAGKDASMTVTAKVKDTSAKTVTNTAVITRAKTEEDGRTHILLNWNASATVDVANPIETNNKAYFFIRIDNEVWDDPDQGYSNEEYIPVPSGTNTDPTTWVAIDNALWEAKACSGSTAVADNLRNRPTPEQIESQLKSQPNNIVKFDKTRDLINWYVIKLENKDQWHVDGSIVYRWQLSYDANGGNGPVPEDSLHAKNETVSVSFASNPTRSGYTFLGWSTDKDAITATYTADGTKTITMPEQDVTLYAVWEKNSYTVSYQVTGDVPEGYAAPDSATVPDGGSHTVAAVPQSQTGTYEGKEGTFTFAGWTKDGLPASGMISDIHADIKLEGVWKFTPANWGKLDIEKVANRTTVRPGKTIKYTITVANNTGMDLEDVVVSDKLATNYLTFKEASAVSGQKIVYNTNTGELTWTIPKLKDGGTAKLTITATVKSGVKDGTVIRNTAVITEAGGKSLTDKPSDSYDVKVSNKISILPETGDTSNIGLWIGVLLAAAVALGVVFIVMMKKKKTR